jgi:23S rRNA pseudouridine1911/1915/1917 synthase
MERDIEGLENNIKIIFEDENILAISKPSGLLVHGFPGHEERTLVDWILDKYPELRDVGETQGDILRSGIIHRLDRDTSGVLVIAKDQETHAFLKKQFQDREISKKYKAIVYGKVKDKEGIIDEPIGRVGPGSQMRTSHKPVGTLRDAVTRYSVNEVYEEYTYLDVFPKTGRTHQIRVHLKHIGHPVLCDPIYAKRRTCLQEMGRLALHASSIDVILPNGMAAKFEAELPKDFELTLAKLKSLC